jgi:predicted dehydrogenase
MLAPKMLALPRYFALAGVVSSDAVRGGNYARQMRVPLLAASVEEMAANPDVDLLVVATRHNRHAEAVRAALRAGKAVFAEKPLATTWDDLSDIEALYKAQPAPPLLMVGFNRRFSPALERLSRELENRRAPLMIVYRLNAGPVPRESWLQSEEGGGRNIGEACHMYDVFRGLSRAPVADIQAQAITPESGERLRNDNFSACLRYEDGSQATLIYTASGPGTGLPKERIEIFCDGQAYIVDDFKSLVRASDGLALWRGEQDKGHAREIELLGKTLAGERPSPLPVDEIFETTAVSLYIEDLICGRSAD